MPGAAHGPALQHGDAMAVAVEIVGAGGADHTGAEHENIHGMLSDDTRQPIMSGGRDRGPAAPRSLTLITSDTRSG